MNQAVFITGGARRLGRHIALHLAKAGYDIALHYHASEQEARPLAAEVRALGRRCELFKADLLEAPAALALMDAVWETFPQLAGLINNASLFERGGLADGDYTLLRRCLAIHVEAPVMLMQAFARRARQGAVINMVDTAISKEQHSYGFYLLSKKALFDMTRQAAVELGPKVRVNAIAPGYILEAPGWGADYRQALEEKLPLKAIATPDHIAQALEYLLNAPSVTGQCLFIDGGEHLL